MQWSTTDKGLVAPAEALQRATVQTDFVPASARPGFTGGYAPGVGQQSLAVSAVWRALNIYANVTSTLPFHAYDAEGDRIDPTPTVVRRPDATMARPRWIRRMVMDMLTRGRCFALKGRIGSDGYPLALIHIPALWVQPISRTGFSVDGWTILGAAYGLDEVVYVPWLEVDDRLLGIGPVEAARRSMDLAYWQAEHHTAMNRDDLSFPYALQTELVLTSEQAQTLLDQYEDNRVRNGKRPAVLHSGVNAHVLGFSPEDQEFLGGRDWSLRDIGRFMGVPATMLDTGIRGGSIIYTNRIDDVASFITFSLMAVVERIEELFTSTEVTNSRVEVHADLNGLLRASPLERAQINEIQHNAGVISAEWWRDSEDIPDEAAPSPEEMAAMKPAPPAPPAQPAKPDAPVTEGASK